MKLKDYYYEWNPYSEEIVMTTDKLRELVRFYKEEYRNAKTDDERQRAMWNLNCYQTELMMRDEDFNVR